MTGVYDPETKLTFWGTGRIERYHQYHQNDSWDWDEASPPIIVDYQHGGKTIKGLVDVGRDGYLWTHNFGMSENWGPVLATAGDVLFAGGTNDRKFRAFDATNRKVLFEAPTTSGVNGVPMSFAVGGKRYIAVQSGWGVDAARMQSPLNLLRPGQYPEVPQGGAIWVYALD